MAQQLVSILANQRSILQTPGLLTVTSKRFWRYDKKGNLKKRRIAPDWRKIDHNPAKIPWGWIPDSWKKENKVDYEREKQLVKFIPGYKPQLRVYEEPNYHEEPIYQLTSNTKLLEGLKQSLYLTKCVLFEDLPERIQQISENVSISNQDDKIIQILRQCLLFDIDPKYLDKTGTVFYAKQDYQSVHPSLERYCPNISENLIRLCQSQCNKYPGLLRRIQAKNLETSVVFRRICDISRDSASHLGRNWLIMVKGSNAMQLLAPDPLENFANETQVKETEKMDLPDIFPVFPIVDLEKSQVYEPVNSTGLLPDFSHSHIHTIVMQNTKGCAPEDLYGQMTSQLFSALFSRAIELYGDEPMNLPKPISGQCIALDGKYFQFMCMQLNTTKLDSDTGIKNMVWIDNRLKEVEIETYGENWNHIVSLPFRCMKNVRQEHGVHQIFILDMIHQFFKHFYHSG
uniref:39S ribosomal protein L37, mitochondrial-like n=1 Tax=Styela clava TaxID=7725 RepID=UPI00193A133C|nr:39S ribosomal protein L37, mitochondrial-like [Styela clava]